MLDTRRFSSAAMADQGIYLPRPDSDHNKRHSSFHLPIWNPDRPTTSSSNFSLRGRPTSSYIPADRNATPNPTKLQPNPSAMPHTLSKTSDRETGPKRKSRFFGKEKKVEAPLMPEAWIILPGQDQRTPFDVNAMLDGHPVRELWDESGDCFVHLFPQSSGKGPSFRIDSSVFASSVSLTKLAFGHLYRDRVASHPLQYPAFSGQFAVGESGSSSGASTPRLLEEPGEEIHLYLNVRLNGKTSPTPPKRTPGKLISDDGQTMVDLRNFFGFLCGSHLIASERRFSLFSIFMRVSEYLSQYQFSNLDGSTFGEVAASSFDNYVIELNLADVRRTTAKSVEMLVLGERMRSVGLYNEAFTHTVGRHEDCQLVAPSTFRMISSTTQTRLSRAGMDLDKRVAGAQAICNDFDMPSLFAGIINSRSLDERRHVDFDCWKSAFFSMKKFVLGYYKNRWGSWPPKPNPKKNKLQTSGLNRVVLLELYTDLCEVYDLLVDREDLTNRTVDGVTIADEDVGADAPRPRALRHILSEWDRSSPPVKPPVPFDVPLQPSLGASRPEYGTNASTDAKLKAKKIKSEELLKILHAAQNPTTSRSHFLHNFLDFQRSQAKGRTIDEIADLRCGQWIFLYAVLQALPLVVVDAPGLLFSGGVEYFLCQASRGGVPWANEVSSRAQQWYGVAGGGGVVSLPADVIENSIDAIYRRSHCWIRAEEWTANDPLLNAAVHEQQQHAAALPAPPEVFIDDVPFQRRGSPVGSRSSSPSRSKRQSVLNLGLEAIPLPHNVSPERRVVSGDSIVGGSNLHASDPTKTFDAILSTVTVDKKKKR